MRMSTVEIQHGLSPDYQDAFIRLFCTTFPEVIVPAFRSIDRWARLLDQSLVRDRILLATADGQLVGLADIDYSKQQWVGPGLPQLLNVMRWRVFRVMSKGIILFNHAKPDTLHLDTLAVRPDVRVRGVRTKLVGAVERLAQFEGKHRDTLDVEDINLRASSSMNSLGFI